jgi:Pyruvate/2-oxoacid:ferredoxin oxidoreductase delta subunit
MNKKGVFPPVVDDEKCILCGTCTLFCPDFAIFIAEDSTLESRGA